MVATEGVPLVHVPPPASVRVVEAPTQSEVDPDMADGNAFTVTERVAKLLQPPLVTV
jgi:hypothetical protein